MPQHCSKKHRFPWGEGKGAIFSLDEVFWYLSPSAEMYPNGDVSLAGSSDRARAHEHRSALRQESGPFPGFPAGCGSQVPDFLVSPPVQIADTRATRNAAALSSWTAAGRASARASSRPRAPSCRPAPRYAGEGAPRGNRQPHGDRPHLLQRPDFLLPKGFT